MAIGGLIAFTCGTCTLLVTGLTVFSAASIGAGAMTAVPALVVGVIPTLFGVAVFYAGWVVLRGPRSGCD